MRRNTDDAPDEEYSGVTLVSNAAVEIHGGLSDSEHGRPFSPPAKRSKLREPPPVVHYSYRNFLPWKELSWKELSTYDAMFQQAFNPDARFAEFLISTGHGNPTAASVSGAGVRVSELFQKELTPSDVGKLNRLVIPKKHAVRYFPEIIQPSSSSSSTTTTTTNDVNNISNNSNDGTMLEFKDREGEQWVFRYCYWSSSQSFVFTKGWNKFVKTKKLSARDKVAFYMCDERRCGRTYFVIEAQHTSRDDDGGEEEEEAAAVKSGDGEEEGSRGMVKKNGFKLFGAFIEPTTN